MLSPDKILELPWYEDQDTGDLYYYDGEKWNGANEVVVELLITYDGLESTKTAPSKIKTEIGVDLRLLPRNMRRCDDLSRL